MLISLDSSLKYNEVAQADHSRFLSHFTDRVVSYKSTSDAAYGRDMSRQATQSIFVIHDNIGTATGHHRGYLAYLEYCWAQHLVPVITPDVIWQGLLCELAVQIKNDPESFRSLFTTSPDKKTLVVNTLNPILQPAEFIPMLSDCVPTRVDLFLPEFSTTNDASRMACYASFMDMVSPYYDYMLCACGFPAVLVLGTADDYGRLALAWQAVTALLVQKLDQAVLKSVETINMVLTQLAQEIAEAAEVQAVASGFWRDMFYTERCGSGSDQVVGGWMSKLYLQPPNSPRLAGRFEPHIAQVDYTYVTDNTKRELTMHVGILASMLETVGEYHAAIPLFRCVVTEKLPAVVCDID